MIGRHHPTFNRLCERAKDRGLAVGIVVGDPLRGVKGAEFRDVVAVNVTPLAEPKGTPVQMAGASLDGLDEAALALLGAM